MIILHGRYRRIRGIYSSIPLDDGSRGGSRKDTTRYITWARSVITFSIHSVSSLSFVIPYYTCRRILTSCVLLARYIVIGSGSGRGEWDSPIPLFVMSF